jgi:hypothetical protein
MEIQGFKEDQNIHLAFIQRHDQFKEPAKKKELQN